MSKAKTNTTETLKEGKQATTAELDAQIKKAAKNLKEEKTVEVFIPEYLKKRLGQNVPVAVNGAVIHVPVGTKVKIPVTMAEVLNESLGLLKL